MDACLAGMMGNDGSSEHERAREGGREGGTGWAEIIIIVKR